MYAVHVENVGIVWSDFKPAVVTCILVSNFQVRTKAGRQCHSRVLNLIRGLEKDCIYFSNEHHLGTFMDRWLEESVEQWQCRSIT